MEFPDIWSNIILNISLRVFLDKINIYSNKLKTWIEEKDWLSPE